MSGALESNYFIGVILVNYQNAFLNPQTFKNSTFLKISFNVNGGIINPIGGYFIVSGEFENNKALNHQELKISNGNCKLDGSIVCNSSKINISQDNNTIFNKPIIDCQNSTFNNINNYCELNYGIKNKISIL
ncbi:hypothetical protein ACTFIY_008184 [Dictyostelium cf. discoideum]